MRAALLEGGLSASGTTGLEMHGTGTALGDPIEMGAACAVLQVYGTHMHLTDSSCYARAKA